MELVKFNKDSSLQRIRASFLDDSIILTDKEKDSKEKMRFVFSLRLKANHSKSSAIDQLAKEYEISLATAYRIYRKAVFVYGELDDTDARAERMVLREHYWRLYHLALEKKDLLLAKKILDSYRELFNFSEMEADIDPGRLKAHVYNLKMSRDVADQIRKQLGKGIIDFNSYPNVEDVNFKEEKDGGKNGLS